MLGMYVSRTASRCFLLFLPASCFGFSHSQHTCLCPTSSSLLATASQVPRRCAVLGKTFPRVVADADVFEAVFVTLFCRTVSDRAFSLGEFAVK